MTVSTSTRIIFYGKYGTLRVLELGTDFMHIALLWKGGFDTSVSPGLRRELSPGKETSEGNVTATKAVSQVGCCPELGYFRRKERRINARDFSEVQLTGLGSDLRWGRGE